MAEPNSTAQPRGSSHSSQSIHTQRHESNVPSTQAEPPARTGESPPRESSSQPDHMAALMRSLGAEAGQVTDAPALTDLLRRLADFHTAERPVEMPANRSSQAQPDNTASPSPTTFLPLGLQAQRASASVLDPTSLSFIAPHQQHGALAASPSRPDSTPTPLQPQPSSAFDSVRILIDSPQQVAVDTMLSHLLEYDSRQQQERDRLRDAEDRADGQAASTSTARVRLNRHFRSRQLPAPSAASPSRPVATSAQSTAGQSNGAPVTIAQSPPVPVDTSPVQPALIPTRPAATAPRRSPPQLDPRPSVRLRLSDESADAGGTFAGSGERIALPAPFQQFTADAARERPPFFTAAAGGAFRSTNTATLANAAPNVGFLELLQPLESTSAPPTVLRTPAADPSQPFAEPSWPEVPVTVNTDSSSSGSGSGSGSDGDRDAPLLVPARSAAPAPVGTAAPQRTAQHLTAESLAKHAAALPLGFALQLDVRLKQSLQTARAVDSTELTRVLQAYLQGMEVIVQEYEAAGALVAEDAPSMGPCATSLDLMRERVNRVCDRARSALRMQGSGRMKAMLEAEKLLAAVLHGNVLHKTALFARCTIVPCLEDDVDVTSLPASHASLLYVINNHMRTMRSIQLRRFQRRQGTTAFAATAAGLVRAQPAILKPCPTWIQARLAHPAEGMEHSALQVLISASLPPLSTFSSQSQGRTWATARPPPYGPGRGSSRPPGIVRPRGASEARMGRGQRAALSISPAGGLGTDSRRARGSGGGHRSTGSRTRPRSDPNRDPLPAPTAAEFPDSLVAYILELFGRADAPPPGPEAPRAMDPDSRQQDLGGGAIAERVERDEDDDADLIDIPELLSPRPRSNAVIWFEQPLAQRDEPLADGPAQHVVGGSIPSGAAAAADQNESHTLIVTQTGPIWHATNVAQVRHVHQGVHDVSGVDREGDVAATQHTVQSARAGAAARRQHAAQELEATQQDRVQGAAANTVPNTGTPVQRLLRVFFGGS